MAVFLYAQKMDALLRKTTKKEEWEASVGAMVAFLCAQIMRAATYKDMNKEE